MCCCCPACRRSSHYLTGIPNDYASADGLAPEVRKVLADIANKKCNIAGVITDSPDLNLILVCERVCVSASGMCETLCVWRVMLMCARRGTDSCCIPVWRST